jgi:hypothetical protein
MSGQKIYQNDIEPDERLINIQLLGSQSGIYLVRLEGHNSNKNS